MLSTCKGLISFHLSTHKTGVEKWKKWKKETMTSNKIKIVLFEVLYHWKNQVWVYISTLNFMLFSFLTLKIHFDEFLTILWLNLWLTNDKLTSVLIVCGRFLLKLQHCQIQADTLMIKRSKGNFKFRQSRHYYAAKPLENWSKRRISRFHTLWTTSHYN